MSSSTTTTTTNTTPPTYDNHIINSKATKNILCLPKSWTTNKLTTTKVRQGHLQGQGHPPEGKYHRYHRQDDATNAKTTTPKVPPPAPPILLSECPPLPTTSTPSDNNKIDDNAKELSTAIKEPAAATNPKVSFLSVLLNAEKNKTSASSPPPPPSYDEAISKETQDGTDHQLKHKEEPTATNSSSDLSPIVNTSLDQDDDSTVKVPLPPALSECPSLPPPSNPNSKFLASYRVGRFVFTKFSSTTITKQATPTRTPTTNTNANTQLSFLSVLLNAEKDKEDPATPKTSSGFSPTIEASSGDKEGHQGQDDVATATKAPLPECPSLPPPSNPNSKFLASYRVGRFVFTKFSSTTVTKQATPTRTPTTNTDANSKLSFLSVLLNAEKNKTSASSPPPPPSYDEAISKETQDDTDDHHHHHQDKEESTVTTTKQTSPEARPPTPIDYSLMDHMNEESFIIETSDDDDDDTHQEEDHHQHQPIITARDDTKIFKEDEEYTDHINENDYDYDDEEEAEAEEQQEEPSLLPLDDIHFHHYDDQNHQGYPLLPAVNTPRSSLADGDDITTIDNTADDYTDDEQQNNDSFNYYINNGYNNSAPPDYDYNYFNNNKETINNNANNHYDHFDFNNDSMNMMNRHNDDDGTATPSAASVQSLGASVSSSQKMGRRYTHNPYSFSSSMTPLSSSAGTSPYKPMTTSSRSVSAHSYYNSYSNTNSNCNSQPRNSKNFYFDNTTVAAAASACAADEQEQVSVNDDINNNYNKGIAPPLISKKLSFSNDHDNDDDATMETIENDTDDNNNQSFTTINDDDDADVLSIPSPKSRRTAALATPTTTRSVSPSTTPPTTPSKKTTTTKKKIATTTGNSTLSSPSLPYSIAGTDFPSLQELYNAQAGSVIKHYKDQPFVQAAHERNLHRHICDFESGMICVPFPTITIFRNNIFVGTENTNPQRLPTDKVVVIGQLPLVISWQVMYFLVRCIGGVAPVDIQFAERRSNASGKITCRTCTVTVREEDQWKIITNLHRRVIFDEYGIYLAVTVNAIETLFHWEMMMMAYPHARFIHRPYRSLTCCRNGFSAANEYTPFCLGEHCMNNCYAGVHAFTDYSHLFNQYLPFVDKCFREANQINSLIRIPGDVSKMLSVPTPRVLNPYLYGEPAFADYFAYELPRKAMRAHSFGNYGETTITTDGKTQCVYSVIHCRTLLLVQLASGRLWGNLAGSNFSRLDDFGKMSCAGLHKSAAATPTIASAATTPTIASAATTPTRDCASTSK